MNLARRSRLTTALIAIISVLFTHVAVAAYVCPTVQVSQVADAIAKVVLAQEAHAGAECEQLDSAQLALCQVHAQVSTQSLDKPVPPEVAPFVPITQASAYVVWDAGMSPIPVAALFFSPARETAPPHSIQHCCFRI